ncbi:glycosyltransferase family 4 protein [Patulibacter sp.]|uniref:glycosyltransferase family 4 protein n=1 Tax=Patulibacter sp. TaxID=1912859 RepID=UPI00272228E5|nr:glycosyltransferase family 4 protein [Patulibacter sp.]MDO9407669.1 glycosyltransferase family 4 protein [Patulibacter sp.]
MTGVVDALGDGWVAGVVVLQDGPLVSALRGAGRRVAVVPAPRGRGLPGAALRLRRALLALDADVVHANGIKAALLCVLAGPGCGRILWMKHDTTGDVRLSRLVALGCADVVGVSRTVMAPFARRRRRAGVVRNGIPERTVDRATGRARVLAALGLGGPDDAADGAGEDPRHDAGGEAAPEVLVLVGRIALGKGQLELVAALPRIVARRPTVRVLLVGPSDPAFPGLDEEILRAAEVTGVGDRVVLTGHRSDAVELIAGGDVLVAPSVRDPGGWREGFGLAVAEAMQAGTPVVAYDSGSLSEVLGDAGEIVPEGDRDGLADAVVALLEDLDRRAALAARGRRRVRDEFPASASIDGLRARYLHLANPRRRRRRRPTEQDQT